MGSTEGFGKATPPDSQMFPIGRKNKLLSGERVWNSRCEYSPTVLCQSFCQGECFLGGYVIYCIYVCMCLNIIWIDSSSYIIWCIYSCYFPSRFQSGLLIHNPPKKTPLFESRTARCMPWLQVQESPGSETPSRKWCGARLQLLIDWLPSRPDSPAAFLLNPDFAGCWANPKPSQISTRLTGRWIQSVMTFPCLEGGTGSTFIVLLEVEGAAGHTSSADIFRTKLVSQSRTRPSQTASIPRAELSALAFTCIFRAFGSSVFIYFFCCCILLAVERWYEPKQNWKLRAVLQ